MDLIKIIEQSISEQKNEIRSYIGASSIGNPCERAIWYGLNQPEDKIVSTRQLLTFEIGKALEYMLIYKLMTLPHGIPSKYCAKEYELFQGTPDLFILDKKLKPIYILEIKTAKDSSFNIFKKKGLRLWYPEYYDQVQSYMGMSGVYKAIMLAINKDSSELHQETVNYDENRYKYLVAKAKRIGDAKIMPEKINESASFFRCKMCFYLGVCHD